MNEQDERPEAPRGESNGVLGIATCAGAVGIGLASARWVGCDSFYELGWLQSFVYGAMLGGIAGVFGALPSVVLGVLPWFACARRWSGASIITPILVVPIVYSSWHRVSVLEILIATFMGMAASAFVIFTCFRRTRGPGLCRACGYTLIDEQCVCSECGLERLPETPPFPRSLAEFRAGLRNELRCSERMLTVVLLAICASGCTGFMMRARWTEGELKAIVADRALAGLSIEEAERMLKTRAQTGWEQGDRTFEFDYLAGMWPMSWPLIHVAITEDDRIIGATYDVEDF